VFNVPREDRFGEIYSGGSYAADETEFLKAIDRYKTSTGRQFLSWHEVLNVLKALGYRRLMPDGSPPEGAD